MNLSALNLADQSLQRTQTGLMFELTYTINKLMWLGFHYARTSQGLLCFDRIRIYYKRTKDSAYSFKKTAPV